MHFFKVKNFLTKVIRVKLELVVYLEHVCLLHYFLHLVVPLKSIEGWEHLASNFFEHLASFGLSLVLIGVESVVFPMRRQQNSKVKVRCLKLARLLQDSVILILYFVVVFQK